MIVGKSWSSCDKKCKCNHQLLKDQKNLISPLTFTTFRELLIDIYVCLTLFGKFNLPSIRTMIALTSIYIPIGTTNQPSFVNLYLSKKTSCNVGYVHNSLSIFVFSNCFVWHMHNFNTKLISLNIPILFFFPNKVCPNVNF